METILSSLKIYLGILLFSVLYLVTLPKAAAQPDCAWIDGYGNTPVSCLDGNITENFNYNSGGFTSNGLKWDATKGYWSMPAPKGKLSSPLKYFITSDIYITEMDGWVNLGFGFRGGNRVDVEILDAYYNPLLTGCQAICKCTFARDANGKWIFCSRLPSPGTSILLAKGTQIRFRAIYHIYDLKFMDGNTLIFDNFSVAGSATRLTSTTAMASTASNNQLQNKDYDFLLKNQSGNFVLYPNPVIDRTTISFDALSGTAIMYLSSSNGSLIRIYKVKKGVRSLPIDLSKEKPGIYIVSLQDEKGKRIVKKIMKYH